MLVFIIIIFYYIISKNLKLKKYIFNIMHRFNLDNINIRNMSWYEIHHLIDFSIFKDYLDSSLNTDIKRKLYLKNKINKNEYYKAQQYEEYKRIGFIEHYILNEKILKSYK